jgi:hypothetical protein
MRIKSEEEKDDKNQEISQNLILSDQFGDFLTLKI